MSGRHCGFGGEERIWATTMNLVATGGADASPLLGIADCGMGYLHRGVPVLGRCNMPMGQAQQITAVIQ